MKPSSIQTVMNRIETRIQETEKITNKFKKSNQLDKTELHRLRIGLRRLQASVHILHSVDANSYVHPMMALLKTLLKETGKVRDEQTLSDLIPIQAQTPEFSHWIGRRETVLAKLERKLPSILQKQIPPEFGETNRHSILAPLSTISGKKFCKHTLRMVEKDCKQLRSLARKLKKHKQDPKFLHGFRVKTKRLRYALELLQPVLPPHLSKLKKLVERNQYSFGKLHDVDFAIKNLKPRSPLLKALKTRRDNLLDHALVEGHHLGKKLSS
jgi:CHAD domain-containing protein